MLDGGEAKTHDITILTGSNGGLGDPKLFPNVLLSPPSTSDVLDHYCLPSKHTVPRIHLSLKQEGFKQTHLPSSHPDNCGGFPFLDTWASGCCEYMSSNYHLLGSETCWLVLDLLPLCQPSMQTSLAHLAVGLAPGKYPLLLPIAGQGPKS